MAASLALRWLGGVVGAVTVGFLGACSGQATTGGATGSSAGAASDGGGGSGGSSSSGAGGVGETPGEGGGGGNELPVALATGEEQPYRIAVDDRYVYWIAGPNLRRAPLAGGDASTLATGTTLGDLAVAAGFVYFTDVSGGTVARVSREGGSVEGLGTGTHPTAITLGPTGVYWANAGISGGPPGDGSLAMSSFDGSASTMLAEGLVQPASVAVDDDFIYFSSSASGCSTSSNGMSCWGGGVGKVPLAGGTPEVVDADGPPTDIVMGERGLYWMIDSIVKRSPRGGGSVEAVAALTNERTGPMALDDEALYLSSTGNGRVVRLPLDGGSPLPLVVDLGDVGEVAVDADWVYVAATGQGRILRVAKDGSAAQPDGPILGPCPAPVGSAQEIELTPREDENLELLSLRVDQGQVTASQDTYERVVADVTAIRALEPALTDIRYFTSSDGRTIWVRPGELALSSIRAGDYLAWDCLNDFYGLRALEILDFTIIDPEVQLELDGIYALDLIARVYAALPGIEHVEANLGGGDGPTICATRAGSSYDYVLDRAGGDCPGGCTTHDAHRFVSTAPGVVEAREVWNSETDGAAPEWFVAACR